MFPTLDLRGRSVLITGAGGGLGLATARAFAEAGARVAINDVTEQAARAAAQSLSCETMVLVGDVSEEATADRLVQSVVDRWGGLDVLVNNAGIVEHPQRTTKQSLQRWRKIMDVNLQAPFLLARAAARHMIERREGAIVNISSITGLVGFPALNAYGVSKAALVMLTKTLAVELARHNIRVNAVAPGFFLTPMTSDLPRELIDANIKRMPMGRVGEAEEIAKAVVFLASSWASFITGVTLPVDGGWTAFGGIGDASRIDAAQTA